MDRRALADWLKTRLTSEAAETEYRELLGATIEQALARPLEAWLPEATFRAALDAHLTPAHLEQGARFVVRELLTRLVAEARADEAPVGRWLTEAAKADLLTLVAQPGWIDRAWVERAFQEQATEAVVADTLYRALKDFSTLVPRIVQGALPNVAGRLAKLGGIATGGVGGRVMDEVEQRLEAEIKRFLEKGTRRALEGAATFAADRIESEEAIASRRGITEFALAQTGAFHAAPLSDARLAEIEGLAVTVAVGAAAREERAALLDRVVGRFYAERGAQPLSEALAAAGVEGPLPHAAWAQATWPAVRQLFEVPAVDAFVERLAGEILDQVAD